LAKTRPVPAAVAKSLNAVAVRNKMNWLYLAIAILSEVLATSALKASDGFTRLLPSIVVTIGYGSAFYFLSLTLRTIPIGVAYAVWSGVGVVLISLLGWVIYGQKLDFVAIFGIALIVLGVLILNLFSQSANH
jgi:small multidrug resistance pump